jgi:hypothetical protein
MLLLQIGLCDSLGAPRPSTDEKRFAVERMALPEMVAARGVAAPRGTRALPKRTSELPDLGLPGKPGQEVSPRNLTTAVGAGLVRVSVLPCIPAQRNPAGADPAPARRALALALLAKILFAQRQTLGSSSGRFLGAGIFGIRAEKVEGA